MLSMTIQIYRYSYTRCSRYLTLLPYLLPQALPTIAKIPPECIPPYATPCHKHTHRRSTRPIQLQTPRNAPLIHTHTPSLPLIPRHTPHTSYPFIHTCPSINTSRLLTPHPRH